MSLNGEQLPAIPPEKVDMAWTYQMVDATRTDPQGNVFPVKLVIVRCSHPAGAFVAIMTGEEAIQIGDQIRQLGIQAKSDIIVPEFKPNDEGFRTEGG